MNRMNRMKKSVVMLIVALILCAGLTVSVFAIDTPWLPINPDTSATEAPSPSESESSKPSDETESTTEDAESGDGQEDGETNPSESGSKETQVTGDDAEGNAPAENLGCQSSLSICAVLTCGITAAVCAIKSRKENE